MVFLWFAYGGIFSDNMNPNYNREDIQLPISTSEQIYYPLQHLKEVTAQSTLTKYIRKIFGIKIHKLCVWYIPGMGKLQVASC
jgi:hypothetical protein